MIFMEVCCSTVWKHQNLFNQFLIAGHADYFPFFIINNASINIVNLFRHPYLIPRHRCLGVEVFVSKAVKTPLTLYGSYMIEFQCHTTVCKREGHLPSDGYRHTCQIAFPKWYHRMQPVVHPSQT